jgi:hypothetical protein
MTAIGRGELGRTPSAHGFAGGVAATALLFGFAACTVILDHGSTQCQTDGDCAGFGVGLVCQSGACTRGGATGSGGSPNSNHDAGADAGTVPCFSGTPRQEQDFLNACPAQCSAPVSCSHNVCSGTIDFDGGALPPPPIDGGSTGGGTSSDAGAPALPSCYDPDNGRGQVVYITGSSNFPPLLAKLAPLLADPGAGGYTPVYRVTSSCDGVRSMLGQAPADRTISDPAPSASAQYATYFTPNGMAVQCTLGSKGATVDVGESDIFSSTCPTFGEPGPTVEHVFGPIQAMAIVVPANSTQKSISAEVAFAVFGRGGKNAMGESVAPWDAPSLYYIRNANTGTQQMIGRAIHVGADQFWGIDRGTAKKVADTLPLLDPTTAEKAIGIISVDFYDSRRSSLQALAFQATGQNCAYLPDSTPFAFDKRNVRDGHYPVWGPLHFFAAAANGVPTSPAALAFLSVVTGNVNTETISEELLNAYIESSLVPTCAMSVQRTTELGSLSGYSPHGQCGCYFELHATGKAPAECVTCTTSQDCTDTARPYCSHGFCEAQ